MPKRKEPALPPKEQFHQRRTRSSRLQLLSPAQVAGALAAHNPGGAESACQPSKSLKTKNFTDDYPSSIHFYYTHKI